MNVGLAPSIMSQMGFRLPTGKIIWNMILCNSSLMSDLSGHIIYGSSPTGSDWNTGDRYEHILGWDFACLDHP